jgi:hypothetical protein
MSNDRCLSSPAVPVDVHPGYAMPTEIAISFDLELFTDLGEMKLAEDRNGDDDQPKQHDSEVNRQTKIAFEVIHASLVNIPDFLKSVPTMQHFVKDIPRADRPGESSRVSGALTRLLALPIIRSKTRT